MVLEMVASQFIDIGCRGPTLDQGRWKSWSSATERGGFGKSTNLAIGRICTFILKAPWEGTRHDINVLTLDSMDADPLGDRAPES